MPDADPWIDAVADYVERATLPLARKILDLEAQLAARPAPERGERGATGIEGSPGKDADEAAIVAKVLAQMPPPAAGLNGKDADEAAIVEKVLARIPAPKDGRDGIDGKEGPPGPQGSPGVPGIAGPPGERGKDGSDGGSGDSGAPGAKGEPGIAGKDGRDGRDALDGLTEIEAELVDERTVKLAFLLTGERRKSFDLRLPIPIYRGIHRDGTKHLQGDAVTRDGSIWIANKDTDSTPPGPDWTLAVKKGRDLR